MTATCVPKEPLEELLARVEAIQPSGAWFVEQIRTVNIPEMVEDPRREADQLAAEAELQQSEHLRLIQMRKVRSLLAEARQAEAWIREAACFFLTYERPEVSA